MLDMHKLRDYLQVRGWAKRRGAGRGLVDVYYRAENRVLEASVPASDDLENYDLVAARALAVVAAFESRQALDVFTDLLFYTDDVLELADDEPDTKNGTISLPRGDKVFSGLRKTLLTTAHLEIEPRQHYARLQQNKGVGFVERCRLGQTKHGSYVMTVACPLNAVPPESNPDAQSLPMLSFTRGVTTRLIETVGVLARCAETENIGAATQTTDTRTLICTNLCDGLLQLIPEQPGGNARIGVRWAKKEPHESDSELPSVVTLKHEYRPFIESVRVRLRTLHVPDAKQLFYGRVDSLAGTFNSDKQREGNVYFNVTDESQEPRKVRVYLSVRDHHTAWETYEQQSNAVVSFRGILRIASGDLYQVENYSDFRVVELTPAS